MAQTTTFASIPGTTTLDTTNWHFNGHAVLGDTPGDTDNNSNEVILTPAAKYQSGQVFFKKPINLTTCTKWRAEFEMRMFDGSAADGIAFCVINSIPTAFVGGGAMGIPVNSHGLKVCFDTYDNYDNGVRCGGNNPEVQIVYGSTYSECDPNMQRWTTTSGTFSATNYNYLKDTNYDKVVISYNNGVVTITTTSTVGLTNPLTSTHTFTHNIGTPLSGDVYFGFTAGTGELFQLHSIRNVVIYADVPETNNAGLDQTICSGQTVQLGVAPATNHTYAWTPATNLSSATIANPTATVLNSTTNPTVVTYTVRSERNNADACYMVDTVRLTVNPGPVLNQAVSFCQGSSVTVRGNVISTAGTHTFALPGSGATGCDSTLVVTAQITPAASSSTSATICQGRSYTFNNQSYSSTGVYNATFPTGSGCDSVASLHLTVTPALTSSLTRQICPGQTVEFNGQQYGTAGTFPITLSTALGCDSIVSLTISLQGAITTVDTLSKCPGESVVYRGQTFSNAGTFPVTISNAQGCDTIVNLTIVDAGTINRVDTISKCQNQSVVYRGQTYTTAGNYNLTFSSANSCDTLLVLTVIDRPVVTNTQTSAICAGEKVTYYGVDYTTAGTYTINVPATNPADCESILILNLTVNPAPAVPLVTTNLPLPCYGEMFVATVQNPEVNETYIWSTSATGNPVSTSVSYNQVVTENGSIFVKASNGNCSSVAVEIPLLVQQLYNDNFDMPNVITPNGDGVNDEVDFNVIFGGCLEFKAEIFNRWGNPVFVQKNNDTGFKGKDSKGVDLTEGTYFYKVKHEKGELQGFIMIVRD